MNFSKKGVTYQNKLENFLPLSVSQALKVLLGLAYKADGVDPAGGADGAEMTGLTRLKIIINHFVAKI